MLKNLQSNLWTLLTCIIVLLCSSSVQAQTTTTYTFTANTWTSANGNWAKSGNGNQFTSGQGVQIATGQSGVVICSPTTNSNITSVVVNYTTNASSGAGNISVYSTSSSNTSTTGTQIGSTTNVTTSGGTTPRAMTFTPSGSTSGFVQVKVNCTTNSIYITSVAITTGASTFSVTYNGNSNTSGAVPTDSNAYASGATVTVLGNTGSLAKTGSTFNGWNTAANGSGTTYQSGNTFAISANTTLYARWATLTPSATALTGFNYTQGSGPSASQSFSLTGSNLNSGGGTITVTGSTNYEVSSDNSTFGSTASITYTGTSLASTPVYVRLKAGLAAGSYNSETISISGGGTTGSVTASGSVSPNTPFISTSGSLNAVSTTYGTASSNTTFSASGSNLTAPIVITAPSGFEISTATGSGFGNSVSLTPTSGTVSSTPIYVRLTSTAPVNSYTGNITLTSTGASTVTVATVSSTVSAKGLTITGLTGGTKEYDGSTTATVTGTATLSGVVNGDSVTLGGTPTYVFATKAVGTGKAITVTGYTISGSGSGNYTVAQPTGLTGTVTAKSVTVTGATVTTKTYDGTTTATVSGGTVVGAISGDTVSVSTTGTFASANAGTGIGVTIALTGADAANYSLTQPGITGTINKANPVFNSISIAVGVGSTYALPGGITTTSDGALSYSTANTAIATISSGNINGVAVGSTTLTVNQAASTNYNAGSTTYTVNVTTITYNNGDFMTFSDGTWSSTAANNTITWKTYSTSISDWVDSSAPSTSNSTNTIYIDNNVTLQGTNTVKNIVVMDGGTFNVGIAVTFTNLTIKSGGTVNKNTNSFNITGTLEVEDNATLNFYHTSSTSRTTSIWGGTEKFHPNSNFVVKSCDNVSGFLVIQTTTEVSEYNGACFGNFIIDYNAGKMQLLPSGFTRTFAKNLIIRNLADNLRSSDGTHTLALTGDLTLEQPLNSFTLLGASGTATVNIGGSIKHNSVQTFRFANNASTVVNATVKGDITFGSTGSIDLSGTAGGLTTINLEGDLTVPSTATLYAGAVTASGNLINFTKAGDGLTAATTQTINIGGSGGTKNQNISFASKNGSYVQLLTNNLVLGTNGKLTVESGSVFNADNLTVSGPTFAINSGGTLVTNNTGGIPASVTATSATYTAGAHYVFNAATTSPFPTSGFNNPGNVTTNANVTLNSTITTTGNLTVNSGTLDLSTFTINRATNGGTITLGNGTTLKINGTNGFPTNYASQVFNTSLVHFAGDAQTINKLSADYYDVKLSGTGAKSFENGTVVGNNLTLDNGPSVTLPANTTITVKNQLVNNGTVEKFVIEDNAALLQTNSVANSGTITVKKNSNALYRNDYTMWSAPVTGSQTMADFSPNTLTTRFYEYDCRNNGSGYSEVYYHVNPATATFVAGRSYLIRMPNENNGDTDYFNTRSTLVYNGVFKGTPNNGTVTRTLNVNGNKFTATGNPYPSPISIADFLSTNSSVLESGTGIYLWRKKNNGSTGSYATVSLAGFAANTSNGTTTGGQANADYFTGGSATWRLAPGQGFIVKTASSATGTPQLTFTNSMRRAVASTGGQSFFRQADSNTSRYWVNLADATGNASQMNVVYMDEATNGIDYGYDALRLEEAATLATYTLAADKGLTIQAKPAFNVEDVVKTGFVAPQAGNYTFAIDRKEGVFANQHIYLKDNVEGITRDLTENSYTFTTEAGTFNDRFEIVYTTEALGTNNPAKEQVNAVVYKSGNTVTVTTETALINGITIYDIRGAKVYAQQGINATTASVSNLNVAHQVLIVEINTSKGIVSKRIIY